MKWLTFGDMNNELGIYECQGQLEQFRNGFMSRVHTTGPTGSVPEPLRAHREVVGSFRNDWTQLNRCMWTWAAGCVPVAFRSPNTWCEHGLIYSGVIRSDPLLSTVDMFLRYCVWHIANTIWCWHPCMHYLKPKYKPSCPWYSRFR